MNGSRYFDKCFASEHLSLKPLLFRELHDPVSNPYSPDVSHLSSSQSGHIRDKSLNPQPYDNADRNADASSSIVSFAAMTFAAKRRKRTGNRAAIYTRYSKGQQHSTEDQVRTCLQKAKDEALVIPKGMIFSDEAISGQVVSRPAFDALMQALADGLIDVVIFLHPGVQAGVIYNSCLLSSKMLLKRDCGQSLSARTSILQRRSTGS